MFVPKLQLGEAECGLNIGHPVIPTHIPVDDSTALFLKTQVSHFPAPGRDLRFVADHHDAFTGDD
jgi:hypothetical protein